MFFCVWLGVAVSIETLLLRLFCAWKPDESNNPLRPMADLWHQLGRFAADKVQLADFSAQPFVTHQCRFGTDRVDLSSNADLDAWGSKLASFEESCGPGLRDACAQVTTTATADVVMRDALCAWLLAVAEAASCMPLSTSDEPSNQDSGARAVQYAAIGNRPQPVLARHDQLKVALKKCFAVMHALTMKVLAVEAAGRSFFMM